MDAVPLDLGALADALVAEDPRVVLLGEQHHDVRQTEFGADLAIALAEAGWLDVLVLEAPRSQTRAWSRALAGEGRPPASLTVQQGQMRERLVAWNLAHPERAFRIVAGDLEHGFTVEEELRAELEAVGRELPDDDPGWQALADDAALDSWIREVADNQLATKRAYRASSRDFWPIRQEQVLLTLTDPALNGAWLRDGENALIWGGSLHTATRGPCRNTRWEGCHLEHELEATRGRTVSVRMEVLAYTPGLLTSGALEPCAGTAITGYNHWRGLSSDRDLWDRHGYDRRIPMARGPYRKAMKGLSPDQDGMYADVTGRSGHDWVVVFGTSSWTLPSCASGG